MLTNLSPIEVRVPETPQRRFHPRTIPLRTQLFREGANLLEALGEVYSRHPEDPALAIVSVGCSIGAEPDTVLSLHKQAGREGRITLTGVDIDKRAIKAAKTGRYISMLFSDGDQDIAKPGIALRAGGFNGRFKWSSDYSGRYEIDAAPVREGHNLAFLKADVRKASLPPADLVMANNVLYHLVPDEATEIAVNLAGMVAPGGVLSIGGVKVPQYMRSLRPGGNSMRYDDWLEQTGSMLAEDHGLTALPVEAANVPFVTQPTIFVRD